MGSEDALDTPKDAGLDGERHAKKETRCLLNMENNTESKTISEANPKKFPMPKPRWLENEPQVEATTAKKVTNMSQTSSPSKSGKNDIISKDAGDTPKKARSDAEEHIRKETRYSLDEEKDAASQTNIEASPQKFPMPKPSWLDNYPHDKAAAATTPTDSPSCKPSTKNITSEDTEGPPTDARSDSEAHAKQETRCALIPETDEVTNI